MDSDKQIGRPKKYHNADEMQIIIDQYFASCLKIKYENGKAIKDSIGNYVYEYCRPLTMSGLANALDMSRQSLINYKNDDEFFDTIERARRKVEMFTEEKLFEKETCNGSKFSLSNNFGWTEKQEVKANINKLEDVL